MQQAIRPAALLLGLGDKAGALGAGGAWGGRGTGRPLMKTPHPEKRGRLATRL